MRNYGKKIKLTTGLKDKSQIYNDVRARHRGEGVVWERPCFSHRRKKMGEESTEVKKKCIRDCFGGSSSPLVWLDLESPVWLTLTSECYQDIAGGLMWCKPTLWVAPYQGQEELSGKEDWTKPAKHHQTLYPPFLACINMNAPLPTSVLWGQAEVSALWVKTMFFFKLFLFDSVYWEEWLANNGEVDFPWPGKTGRWTNMALSKTA